MTVAKPPKGLTASQRRAWTKGATEAQASVDVALAAPQVVVDVSTDLGAGRRGHLDWCLRCQTPLHRCPCGKSKGRRKVRA
jgi:hypothetical protein